jgi:iron complex transport system substrate-binding protein
VLSTLRRALAVTAAALVLAACSGGTDSTTGAAAPTPTGSAAAYPVTLTHAFGSTVLERQPQRVATVSWVNADVALALGVVPVGMPKDEYGGNDRGSTPWKDAALEAAGAPLGSDRAPVQYSEADGINFAEVAQTTPDVILAAYSGLTREDYDKLSKIAPVVAHPEVAYGTPWQESTRIIGTALGRTDRAEQVVAETEALIADRAAAHPQIKGKTFLYGNLEPASGKGVNIYTASDNRPRFLTSLGMQLAPAASGGAADAFYLEWSPERADELAADVFVTWVPDDATKAAIAQDPLLGQIPAVRTGALVADADNTLTLSVSAASPLSLPWALDRFLPQLAAAADRADAA